MTGYGINHEITPYIYYNIKKGNNDFITSSLLFLYFC